MALDGLLRLWVIAKIHSGESVFHSTTADQMVVATIGYTGKIED
jgi:hypothetical protein